MASVVVNGDTSGAVTLTAPAVAGTVTVTLPAASGTMASLASVTANGVTYVNSSSQPTSGSALVFDGSNLGVGVTPVSQNGKVFHIDGGAGAADIRLTNNATGSAINNGALFTLSGSDAYLWNLENNVLSFGTNNTERARIDTSGNLLVGTTSTDPIGNGSNGIALLGSSGCIDVNRSAAPAMLVGRYTSTGQLVNFYYANSSKGNISTDGTNVAYNTSSDYRLKENIVDLPNALATVIQLKPRQFDWKETNITTTGFIAHELAEVVPQCVTGEKDAVDEDGKPVYQGIDTSFLVATLTAAIQEQQALITQLQADVAALKGAA